MSKTHSKALRFDRFRRWFNPILRRLLHLELCRIERNSETIGIGIRLWQK